MSTYYTEYPDIFLEQVKRRRSFGNKRKTVDAKKKKKEPERASRVWKKLSEEKLQKKEDFDEIRETFLESDLPEHR